MKILRKLQRNYLRVEKRSIMKPVQLTEDLLLSVRKPARYIGEEHNSIKKEWDKADVRVCLCYPDLYEIGMSNLGLKILYHVLNKRDGVLCERSFTPWPDMEEAMLKNSIPLFSLENKAPLSEFDILGFSFSYELSYTNLLTMLSLSNIPFKYQDRQNGDYPLIIAGGPCVFNPGPIADFIDLFLIGDGEEAVFDIIDIYTRYRPDKKNLLDKMTKIEGVYVPSRHGKEAQIKKRTISILKPEDFPIKPIVPYIQTVHDRITLEVMRGCPNQCHFCQAKSIYHPVRVRDRKEVLALARESYKNTGFDDISLLSLSSSNYPGIDKLIKELTEIFLPSGVGISLPSLRIEEKVKNLPALISVIKKSSLTFAPEAGTEKMLKIINKKIDRNMLFKVLRYAYANGWRRIKLYFMIGLPSEEDKDIEAIIGFADAVAMLKKEVSRHPAEVIVSISSFIPKPHTYFEREKMASEGELKAKQNLLEAHAKKKGYLKLKFHDIKASILEALFSRGDRDMSQVLLDAWRLGVRFDAWSESFNPKIWDEAITRCGLDKALYLSGRGDREDLPWSFIKCYAS
jgi:radical SAM family uncharacterized protein